MEHVQSGEEESWLCSYNPKLICDIFDIKWDPVITKEEGQFLSLKTEHSRQKSFVLFLLELALFGLFYDQSAVFGMFLPAYP